MKFLLWQQFSSNHSAHFAVVGKFATPEQANAAADEVRAWMAKIVAFWQAMTPEQHSHHESSMDPTPPEIELNERYHLGDGAYPGVDWLYEAECLENAINVWRNFVLIEPRHSSTWTGQRPFDVLLQKLGGKIARSGEMSSFTILWHIDFDVASDDAAAHLNTRFNEFRSMRKKPADYPLEHRFDFTITQTGHHFHLTGGYHMPLDYINLPRFISFLESHGAQHIQVDVEETSEEESDL